MAQLPNAVQLAVELAAQGRFADLGRKASGLIYQRRLAYGLRRDLEVPLKLWKAKIPISVREFRDSDRDVLLPRSSSIPDRKERIELATRQAHADAGIPTCFVAIDDRNGAPCYFQWLMGSEHNDKIQSFFGPDWFPILKPDEALLENAYTPPEYRGNGIMSEAMALIAAKALDIGCRYVVTFVEVDNIASLKGCERAGFAPYTLRSELRLLHRFRMRQFEAIRTDEAAPDAVKLAS